MLSGITLSVAASVLFGALYYYAVLLHPLEGVPIFAWRVVLGLPLLTVLLLLSGAGSALQALLQRIHRTPSVGLGLLLSGHMMALQMALFMWAPLNGRALDTTLGYFLLPLAMVLAGRLFYQEKLSAMQGLAVALAAWGVGHALAAGGSLAWPTAVVAIGYPLYFMLRRKLEVPSLPGLWAETLAMLPLALWILADQPVSVQLMQRPALMGLLPLLGLMSVVALGCYLSASRRLPLGLFGLLGYLEPALLFAVSLLLGERMAPGAGWTYGPIWLALLVLMAEGAWHLQQRRA